MGQYRKSINANTSTTTSIKGKSSFIVREKILYTPIRKFPI
ncbi:hypothetical protein LEP1GSC058_1445 [Leptospira fainei serovar Hurstbridge str. BUT 6]|uniref:Uncharacterized protein n=1 Tax=Leptospira fainei serovar Hurstbridge str. BUT 6 TaxID=1193011 RepID=S3V1F7_9LEPT|nr:hypothetical protein LEP1GSC058_1445 [Leptospira fainei serovar Hurstbridge str. BUT 6]